LVISAKVLLNRWEQVKPARPWEKREQFAGKNTLKSVPDYIIPTKIIQTVKHFTQQGLDHGSIKTVHRL
jgi:hypothetical protein